MIRIVRHIVPWCIVSSLFFLSFFLRAHAATSLENPLNSDFSSIPNFIAGVLKAVVMISLPIITLFFVVVGFKFISAQGNPSKLETAKDNFMYAIVGALLIMGAWVIATLIAGTVTQLVGK